MTSYDDSSLVTGKLLPSLPHFFYFPGTLLDSEFEPINEIESVSDLTIATSDTGKGFET